jgi:hypothetical protein
MQTQNSSETKKDKWVVALEVKQEELQKCQQSNSYKSCSECAKLLECELRKSYVLAVYESMNKGQGGGFEF